MSSLPLHSACGPLWMPALPEGCVRVIARLTEKVYEIACIIPCSCCPVKRDLSCNCSDLGSGFWHDEPSAPLASRLGLCNAAGAPLWAQNRAMIGITRASHSSLPSNLNSYPFLPSCLGRCSSGEPVPIVARIPRKCHQEEIEASHRMRAVDTCASFVYNERSLDKGFPLHHAN